MPQIQRRHAVGVGQPPVGTGVEIQAGDEVEQPAVGTVRDLHRQGFLIEAKKCPDGIRVVDATPNLEIVQAAIRAEIGPYLTRG